MSLVLTAAPAVEPVTLAEAKAHCRIDGTAEDAFVSSLIITSRLQIEQALGLSLITQGWIWRLDAWPRDGAIVLPMHPVSAIDAVTVIAADGTPATLETWRYVLDGHAIPARLLPTASRFPEPAAKSLGIEIAFTAGFGSQADDVPAPLRHAILLLVAHWFENREPVGAHNVQVVRMPAMIADLLAPYRAVRI